MTINGDDWYILRWWFGYRTAELAWHPRCLVVIVVEPAAAAADDDNVTNDDDDNNAVDAFYYTQTYNRYMMIDSIQ